MFIAFLRLLKAALRSSGMLPITKRLIGPFLHRHTANATAGSVGYRFRISLEQATYADVEEVHDLPDIFHYWSNKYLLPKCQAFGFSHPDELFVNHLEAALRESSQRRFISIGSGNCDMEVRLAKTLKARGHGDFVIECLDINLTMLERGQELAKREGVEGMIAPLRGDFNLWRPQHAYGVVIANQSLHHVVELEHLFDAVKDAIGADGRFVTADMIGRNGHQRWPEALALIQELWKDLPKEQRYNRLLGRQEDKFLDWDYSISGFEGIRAQDILPLLVERFHFQMFLPFGNLIDPFTDRAFGYNFDAKSERDRVFIDRVHACDEEEMLAGRIKPTHMMAVLRNSASPAIQQLPQLTPQFCVRVP